MTDEAETFLRLIAEAELRRAIELPKIRRCSDLGRSGPVAGWDLDCGRGADGCVRSRETGLGLPRWQSRLVTRKVAQEITEHCRLNHGREAGKVPAGLLRWAQEVLEPWLRGAGIAAASALRPRPAVTVVLTDGYTPWPADPPRGMRVIRERFTALSLAHTLSAAQTALLVAPSIIQPQVAASAATTCRPRPDSAS